MEPLTHHALGAGKPPGGQGRAALAVQVRASEVKLAPDAGTGQVDRPVGLEPPAAEHVRGDGEPLSSQRGAAPAV